MDIDVTPRQFEFLQGLCKLAQAERGPVHYTQVAARLGVNRFSAYDMLKTLEAKRLVTTTYVLDADKEGPGRSRVLFAPTPQGQELVRRRQAEQAGSSVPSEEWTAFKDNILRRLQEARNAGSRELLHELIARLPERRRPLHYCAQMISALVLNLQRVQGRVAAVSPLDALAALASGEDEDLSVLAGLSLGSALMADERTDPSLIRQLVGQIQTYQQQLRGLSAESKDRLRTFLHEAIQVFSPSASPAAPVTGSSKQN